MQNAWRIFINNADIKAVVVLKNCFEIWSPKVTPVNVYVYDE